GSVSDLNGGFPWGVWIAFDLLIGTGFACGGWALAWAVYVFNRGQYHPLVRPALFRWQGATETSPFAHPGLLAEPLANPGERRHFMRVAVDQSGKVRSAGFQASHILSSAAAANGLVDVPPRTELPAGT
uniref:hypothetical protein n=1 Tax=Acinetobacter baumannii TaxID=470 RepID=UPI003399D40D